MRLSLFSLALAVPGALAAVDQRCIGFESPAAGYDTSLRVLSYDMDTSVLIYHIKDIEHTNIPLVVDDETLMQELGGFSVCTQKKAAQGYCENVGRFTLDLDGENVDPIDNLVISAGKEYIYEIPRPGVYCAVTYQEGGPDLTGVKIVEVHWYGTSSLEQWESLKIIFAISILISISQGVLQYMFRDNARKGYIGTLLDDMRALFSLKAFILMFKSLCYMYLSATDDWTFTVFDPFFFLDSMFNIIVAIIFYKLSIGVFGLKKDQFTSLNLDFKTKLMFRLYCASSLLLSFGPFLSTSTVFAPVFVVSFLIVSTIWIPLFFIMWRNAKATEREMVDPVFARNYSLTRKAVVFIPVMLWLTSIAGQILVQVKSMGTVQVGSGAPSFVSNFTSAIEAEMSQNFWFVLLKHLPDFSILLVQWAIIAIWKPKMLERTEDIHSNELSDRPHAALKLEDDPEEQVLDSSK